MPALSEFDHIKDFNSADKVLGDRNSKVIGNNTELVKRSQTVIVVELHGHAVVKYHRDGRVQVSSAGHKTSTTKDRINRYTPNHVSVVQRDFDWYLKKGDEKVPFRDKMFISE